MDNIGVVSISIAFHRHITRENRSRKVGAMQKKVKINKTKSIGVSEANYSCIWFLNGGIINRYQ